MHVLDTERLALRWLEPADAAFILELTNDPDWLRHIGDRGIRSLADATRYIAEGPRAMCERLGFGLYCVVLRQTGTAIGLCGLIKRDWLDDVDIGFAFLPAFRGCGYALEAAAATLRYAQDALGLHSIAAIVSPANADSIRLLEKLGLKFERMVAPPQAAAATRLYITRTADCRTGPVVRDARAGDFDAILALNERSVALLSPLSPRRLLELDTQAALHRVVERDGAVAGFLLAFREGTAYDSPNYQWFATRYPRFLYVDRVVVAATARGAGLGTLLYRDMFGFAAATGVNLVTCEFDVDPPNPASAQFHASFGFGEVGRQWVGDGKKQVSLQVAAVRLGAR